MGVPMRPAPIQPIFCAVFDITKLSRCKPSRGVSLSRVHAGIRLRMCGAGRHNLPPGLLRRSQGYECGGLSSLTMQDAVTIAVTGAPDRSQNAAASGCA